jgi:hypothetical protein
MKIFTRLALLDLVLLLLAFTEALLVVNDEKIG